MMNPIQSIQYKKIILYVALGVFMLNIIGIYTWNQVFQGLYDKETDQPEDSLNLSFLDARQIKSLTIKNNLGAVELYKNQNSKWMLNSNSPLRAKQNLVDELLKNLQNSQVLKVLPNDQLNLDTYAINTPLSVLSIRTQLEEAITLYFGMYNSLNRSTYIKSSQQDHIFEIKEPGFDLSSLEARQLIDDRVFNIKALDITQLQIHSHWNKSHVLDIKKNNFWIAHDRKKQLVDEKVENFLYELTTSKIDTLIDKTSDDTTKFIKKYLDRPLYTLKIVLNNGTSKSYLITGPISSNQELKIATKKTHIIIQSIEDQVLMLVRQEFLELMKMRSRQLD